MAGKYTMRSKEEKLEHSPAAQTNVSENPYDTLGHNSKSKKRKYFRFLLDKRREKTYTGSRKGALIVLPCLRK